MIQYKPVRYFIAQIVCKIFGHKYHVFNDGFTRLCTRCDREEWLMTNTYPKVGEPKHFWQYMAWRDLGKRRLFKK